jgi:hypothetical protein
MQRCINQVFRSKIRLPAEMRGGKGDCTICTPDEKNKNCPGFYPIAIFTFEVKEANREVAQTKSTMSTMFQ